MRVAQGIQRHGFFKHVVSLMSPGLRGRVSMHVSGAWISRVPFLNCAGTTEELRLEHNQFVVQVTRRLQRMAYIKGEVLMSEVPLPYFPVLTYFPLPVPSSLPPPYKVLAIPRDARGSLSPALPSDALTWAWASPWHAARPALLPPRHARPTTDTTV